MAFADACAVLIGRPLGADEPFAVAVSGGPDSLALLWLAHDAFGARVKVLTVDHGLRPEAVTETAGVAARAASLGLACTTLRWDGPHPAANLQAAARAARYRLMGDWCAAHGVAWLATAHHRDDQAETLLLRLARGSGGGGLSGIRPRRTLASGIALLRPLLDTAKADLAAIVAAAGWPAVDDPSNHAARFDRTRARALLADTPWLSPRRLAATAAHLAEAEAALDWTADLAWAGHATATPGRITLNTAGLPRELARRLVLRAIGTLAPGPAPRGTAIDRLIGRLATGGAGTLGGVRARARARTRDSGDHALWDFAVAAPRG